ncbi:hypothetical protein [Arthrobacter zhaoxinii]|uniref:hypothetical protein n=1 Tax=Arthrobacter zhaoxinii TaxID=2964616 RepID=UPI002105D318|nr:hypothetical protein [Arthrobacter zhaoxinii]MCQ2001606.1 hypothetical protein [Arthrobacter zhaoxinii]
MTRSYQYRANASSPSFDCTFASSGITGSGTFSAGPSADAGLYLALGVGVDVGVGVGDTVAEEV